MKKIYLLFVLSVLCMSCSDDFISKNPPSDLNSEGFYKTETDMNRQYPYNRFILAETPISFASYFRNTTGKAEFVQPELIFLPEKGMRNPF